MADQFDKLTERSRKVLTLAQEEARRFNHDYIGAEHLLLGLVREGDGVAARVLSSLGVQLPKVRSAVEFIVGRGEGMVAGELVLALPAKQAIERAFDEARSLNHRYIGTEHLLLGLVHESENVAAGVLESLGVSLEQVRTQVMQVVNQSGGYGHSRPGPPRPAPASEFDRFTERARRVLTLAQEEAQRFNHNYIGTEHLLLGLVREGEGVAARVLTNLGVRLPQVRSDVEFIIGRGEGRVIGEIGLTPRAKKVIELAVDEARRLNHHYVGTEHLLLGLVREGEGIAAGVLESRGVSLNKVRAQIMQVVNQSAVPAAAAGPELETVRPRLGTLVQVLPVAQTQRQDDVEVTLLALEIYSEGFLATFQVRLVGTAELHYLWPTPEVRASDDQESDYTGYTEVGWGQGQQARLTAGFAPALAPAARALRLEVPEVRWRPVSVPKTAERAAGPWSFTVALPS